MSFEWLVMPFSLKNASVTYKRVKNANFHDMLGHHMEVYIDDIMVKSKGASEHVDHLRKSFEMMRHHQLKLNPLKCAFGVHAAIFLVPSSPKRDRSGSGKRQKLLLQSMLHKSRNNSKSSWVR